MRRGLDRGYISQTDQTSRLRGRVDFGRSLKTTFLRSPALFCKYDELSYDVLYNQIIRTTISRLLRVKELDGAIRQDLRFIDSRLHHVSLIPLARKHFAIVQLHSNNSFYDFLLKVCELVHDNLLISEVEGDWKFRDFLRDEKAMGRLFENFVRNFYRLEQSEFAVGCEIINWQARPLDATPIELLPAMRTDVSLTSRTSKIVIETKYYVKALQTYYDRHSIRSENLYRLFSYLENLPHDREMHCEGVLLYPTTEQELDFAFEIKGHKVRICTVNLDQDWQGIHRRLLELVG
jgi:5-methylcytosine-specific restriction enzyme subunit McrC